MKNQNINKKLNKKYRVGAFKAKACLKTALDMAISGRGVSPKQYGSSYSFEAGIDDVINFSTLSSILANKRPPFYLLFVF